MKTEPGVSFENTEVAFAHKSDASLRKMYRLFTLMNLGLKMEITHQRIG